MITLTQRAVQKLKDMLYQSDKMGVRIRLEKKGCSGFSYVVDYTCERIATDEVVEKDGVRVFIDANAQMALIGSVMDYEENTFSSGFVFDNPNEKGRCGCGESFTI